MERGLEGEAALIRTLSTGWPRNTGTVIDLVGNTPMFALPNKCVGLADKPAVRILVKLERFNPGGSIKDRPAAMMLWHALKTGALQTGQTIVDSTSGNTGVALAMFGSALGFSVLLTMPASATIERQRILAAYGAEVVLSDPALGSDGAIERAYEISQQDPGAYFTPDQYDNPANPWAHYLTTGPEIWSDTKGEVTHLVAGIGTGGTITGTSAALHERNPDVVVVAVEPDQPDHDINGMRHIPSTRRPGIYDPGAFSYTERVSTEDSITHMRKLIRHGLFVGVSSGAILAAALRLAASIDHGTIVAIMPDGAGRYLSKELFQPVDRCHAGTAL